MHRLLTLCFVLFSISLSAQYERGNWYLSGNSTLEFGNQSTAASSEFLPQSPGRSGYFLLDRLLIGGSVLTPSAFVRYYQPLKPRSKLAAFAELNLTYFALTSIGLQPAVGLEYQLSPSVLLSAKLQQTFGENQGNRTSLQFGINTVIGRSGLDPGQNLLRKGSFFIDPNIGQITYSSLNVITNSLQSVRINLHLGGGLMLSDRVSLDGSISASNYQTSSVLSENTKLIGIQIAADLGLRYFLTSAGKLRPYVGAGVTGNYRLGKAKYETPGRPDYVEAFFEFSPQLKLGTLFFLSDNVALDASLEYNFRDNTASRAATSQLGLGVGVKIFLGGKKEE